MAGGDWSILRSGGNNGGSVSAGTSAIPQYSWDSKVAAAGLANDYQAKAEGALASLLSDARSGADIGDYLKTLSEAIGTANKYASQGVAAANEITNVVGDVQGVAGNIVNVASKMGDYEPILRQMGEEMYGKGGDLAAIGNEYLNIGRDILGLNSGAGGLAGEYLVALRALDPSLAVTQAVTDTQQAFQSANAQAMRDQARRGVSPGSGASAALQGQYKRALATALAAVKTRARTTANESYLSRLAEALKLGTDVGTSGAGIAKSGFDVQSAGAAATRGAAEVLSAQSQAYSQGAVAYGTAGQLLSAQASAYNNAASATVGAGNLAVSGANAQVNATNSLIAANTTAMEYYAAMFNNYATIAGDQLFDPGEGSSSHLFSGAGKSLRKMFKW